MQPDRFHALDAVARRQHGLVTRRQLEQLGYRADAIRWLLRSGRLNPVRRGAYRLCGIAPSWQLSALAALMAAGEGAVLSHRSAGILWGLVERFDAGPLHLTVPGQCRLDGVVAHRSALNPGEVTRRDMIPVTRVERTLLDLSGLPGVRPELGRLVDEALRRGLTSPGRLLAALETHGGPGRRLLCHFRAALADRGLGYDPGANDWEQQMDRMWDRMGLPPARRQYRVRVSGGRSYRPDRTIVDARIAVDWNGYGPHGTRSRFDYDSDRRARLTAAGWLPLDFTSRSAPELICDTVLTVYRERLQLLRAARPEEATGPD